MTGTATSNASLMLRAWELTRGAAVWLRPAALLSALSGVPLAEAVHLGVARRDAALLAWRSALFGANWQAFAQCPACDTMLEYELPELGRSDEDSSRLDDTIEVEFMGQSWTARWPNSRDLYEASQIPDRQTARDMLLRRMLPEDAAPDPAAAAILAAVADMHRGLLTLDLRCCACPRAWTVAFDPGEFLWRELRAAARRVLREIDLIARVYHWSEDQILALSDARRREYLQLVQ